MDAEECAKKEAEGEELRREGHRVVTVFVYRDTGYDAIANRSLQRLEGIELHHYPLTCPQCKEGT